MGGPGILNVPVLYFSMIGNWIIFLLSCTARLDILAVNNVYSIRYKSVQLFFIFAMSAGFIDSESKG